MIKAITLRSFPAGMAWMDCFRESRASGFDGVEVNFDGMFDLDCPMETLQEIRKTARLHEIKIASVYSRQQWQTPISSRDPQKSGNGCSVIRRLIDIAEILEAPTVLVIPGSVDNSIVSKDVEIIPYDEAYERVLNVLSGLSEIAFKKGVFMALENVGNKFLLSPLETRDFIDRIGSYAVGCHFDVANCLYCGGYPEQWIRILAHRIKAVHLKDYRLASGNLTGFAGIFDGDVNWEQVCNALSEINFDGALISEVLPAYKYHPEMLWKSASLSMDLIIEDIRKIKEEVLK